MRQSVTHVGTGWWCFEGVAVRKKGIFYITPDLAHRCEFIDLQILSWFLRQATQIYSYRSVRLYEMSGNIMFYDWENAFWVRCEYTVQQTQTSHVSALDFEAHVFSMIGLCTK